jgi:SNF family Na+-dependent transporter
MASSSSTARESWGTRIGVILAVTGGAVGPGIFRTIRPNRTAAYFGTLVLIVPVLVYTYYVFIAAWCLGYAWYAAIGALDLGPEKRAYIDFFADFVGSRGDGSLPGARGAPALVFLVPCALVVLVRVLTLGTPDPEKPELNVLDGLGFTWNPSTERVGFLESPGNPPMWMEAAGQIFFSRHPRPHACGVAAKLGHGARPVRRLTRPPAAGIVGDVLSRGRRGGSRGTPW